MVGARRGFSAEELADVLGVYDIGQVQEVTRLSAGSSRSSKAIVVTEKGKFLLKRCRHTKATLDRVNFAHSVHRHLASADFPVSNLLVTNENATVLHLNRYIYELFEFVEGERYNGTEMATVEAGRQLANFHQCLAGFCSEKQLNKTNFHDSSSVRRRLKMVGADKSFLVDRKLEKAGESLMRIYNASSVRVNCLGFDSWDEQVVHGDWHRGNLLFRENKLVAVFDFDSVRVEPALTDLANGMLQFSIIGDRPNPADWPDHFDQSKINHFLSGYRQVIDLEENKLFSLIDLMIETMVAEAILPVTTTGFFGNSCGLEFLKMINRKSEWLCSHRDVLLQAITHTTNQ